MDIQISKYPRRYTHVQSLPVESTCRLTAVTHSIIFTMTACVLWLLATGLMVDVRHFNSPLWLEVMSLTD